MKQLDRVEQAMELAGCPGSTMTDDQGKVLYIQAYIRVAGHQGRIYLSDAPSNLTIAKMTGEIAESLRRLRG